MYYTFRLDQVLNRCHPEKSIEQFCAEKPTKEKQGRNLSRALEWIKTWCPNVLVLTEVSPFDPRGFAAVQTPEEHSFFHEVLTDFKGMRVKKTKVQLKTIETGYFLKITFDTGTVDS